MTLKIFKTGNFVNIYVSVKKPFQQYCHFQQYENCVNLKPTFQSKKKTHTHTHTHTLKKNPATFKNMKFVFQYKVSLIKKASEVRPMLNCLK